MIVKCKDAFGGDGGIFILKASAVHIQACILIQSNTSVFKFGESVHRVYILQLSSFECLPIVFI